MKLLKLYLITAFALFAFAAPPAMAQISQGVRVCDPSYPSRCIKPNADGSLNTSAVGGGTTVTATAADPTYVEGSTSNPLSVDLSGHLRVTSSGGGGGGAVTVANGADVTQGAIADAAATAGGTGTSSAKLRLMTTQLGTINTTLGSPLQSGGPVTAATTSSGVISIIQADTSAALTTASAATTQLVALSSGKKIYVSALDVIAAGTTNVTFVYGTGSNCGTGTTSLTGAYPLTAQAGIAKGSGLGPVLVVPASNALCVTNSAAIQISGSVAYAQF